MPSSRVHLEKLTVPQLVKKLPEFYGTLEFIIMFNSVTLVPALSYINPAYTLPICSCNMHPNIILPSKPRGAHGGAVG